VKTLLLFFLISLLSRSLAALDINGIPIDFIPTAASFPQSWNHAPINGYAEPLDSNETERTMRVLNTALRKYDSALLHRNLKHIYVFRRLSFYGVGYGGSFWFCGVYFWLFGLASAYSDTYIEQVFHHEFSSILLRNYPRLLDTALWKSLLPEGFCYSDPLNGVGAIKKGEYGQSLTDALCNDGFADQYALSSLENDFNTFAAYLFCPTETFYLQLDNHVSMLRKFALMVAFYRQINPMYSDCYFRSLAGEPNKITSSEYRQE
jgi:hypothetical protein